MDKMAVALTAAPSLPLATPWPDLRARQTVTNEAEGDCYESALDDSNCVTIFVNECLTVSGISTDYITNEAQEDACLCSGAAAEMTCLSNYMVSQGCTTDYNNPNQPFFWSVASDYVSGYCNGSVPADILSKAHNSGTGPVQVPATPTPTAPAATTTTISLVLVSVVDVTPTTSIAPVTHTSLPTYSGSGTLLGGHCGATSYTILNDTETAFVVPFVGCDGNRPECCPFTANDVAIGTATAGGTVTLTATGTVTPTASVLTANSGYPVPFNGNQFATLSRCPADYTDLGTACCPSGYLPFTKALMGQTPCYSSLAVFGTTPVTLTAGVDYPLSALAQQLTSIASNASSSTSAPTASFPTSAVVNVVWAMQYPKTPSGGGGLGAGAIAGIVVGSLVGLGAIAVLTFFFLIRGRGRKMNNSQQPPAQQPFPQPQPGQPPVQYAPPPMGAVPGGQPMYYEAPPQPVYYVPAAEPGKEGAYVQQSGIMHPSQGWATTSPDSVSVPTPQWSPSQGSTPGGLQHVGQPPFQQPYAPAIAEAEAVPAQRHELAGGDVA